MTVRILVVDDESDVAERIASVSANLEREVALERTGFIQVGYVDPGQICSCFAISGMAICLSKILTLFVSTDHGRR
jgi:hypothetical protein